MTAANSLINVWDAIKNSAKPVVLYGTGDAAEKILKELDARSIRVSGVFASDGFVRDREFGGLKVTDYRTAKETFGGMTVVLCFGSHRPEVLENILRIDREQDLYAPDLPIAGERSFDECFFSENEARLAGIRKKLADWQSRLVFDKVIEYKLSGRIAPLIECSTPEEDNWRLFAGRAEQSDVLFADLGAYTGDTVELFRKIRGNNKDAVVAFEPEPRNFRKLSENPACLENAELVNAAAWECDGTAFFEKGRGRGTHSSLPSADRSVGAGKAASLPDAKDPGGQPAKTIKTMLRSLDGVLSGRRADFIKMDIEGAEHSALTGAAHTITAFKPAMLIAAYHRAEDLFDIPETVLSMRPDYSIYLRKDPAVPAWGVNYIFI